MGFDFNIRHKKALRFLTAIYRQKYHDLNLYWTIILAHGMMASPWTTIDFETYFNGTKANWKNEPEALTILTKSLPNARKVLVIDDILETGRSLKTGVELLKQLNIDVVGAFYLLNAASDVTLGEFSFPIRSALKHRLF